MKYIRIVLLAPDNAEKDDLRTTQSENAPFVSSFVLSFVEDGYENHKDYFDDFFNEGKYANYSRVALNNYVEQNSLIKVGKLYKIGKIVVISYNDLRKQLETDKVIKGLNYGF